ncbi:MAG: hypothetical protein WBW33_37535 [Bryobacteraceae bacterium]
MNAEVLLKYFDRISEAPDAVPRLRQFVLELAVRGKLVDQDPNDEPASALLARIPSPAQDRARKQALMGRNPPEQMTMIAAQPPYTAQYPDRSSPPRSQGADTNPHNATSGIIFDGAAEQRSPIRATGTSDRPAKSPSGAEGRPYEPPASWRRARLAKLDEAEAQANSLRYQLKAIRGEALLR